MGGGQKGRGSTERRDAGEGVKKQGGGGGTTHKGEEFKPERGINLK